ncbi:MAG: hypothetical protein FGM23_08115 [Alphaproteobacteria bacterium]|nr:hypothetical protein [Alphaproteobacteria bacterium]
MQFSKKDIEDLNQSHMLVKKKYQSLLLTFAHRQYQQKEAQEYAIHGFLRRLKILKRCIDNVYSICPPDIDQNLSEEKISDLTINLQAFVFNLYGSLDNLAWVWVKEKGILNEKGERLSKSKIGFSKKDKYKAVRNTFSPEFQAYLKTLDEWFDDIENFRHALAHRIPLYVPPYIFMGEAITQQAKDLENRAMEALNNQQLYEHTHLMNEIEMLGKFVPLMTHSFSEDSKHVVFHAQIIADWNTVVQISENFIKELDC